MDLDLLSSGEDEDHVEENCEVDYDSHVKLLDAISSLDGSKKRKPLKQRTESSHKVDEFNLNEGSKISIRDLVGSLDKSKHLKLKKQVRTTSKQRILQPPLPKHEAEKTKRTVAYNKVSAEVDKWNSVIQKNRLADQIVYPLKQADLSIQPIEEVSKRFKHKTPMEQEIDELLQKSKNVMTQAKELTVAEEEALKAMSLEEAIDRRNQLRKMRALQSYQEAKARRQNKIKSKKYHRILKKEKLKKEMKEFEQLQKDNPELALQKLEDMEKNRIGERMTLKHRNTGKWAKQKMLIAKYNPEAREALREQIEINKKLTEKKRVISDSESEDELILDVEKKNNPDDYDGKVTVTVSEENPWMKSSKEIAKELARKSNAKAEVNADFNERSEAVTDSSNPWMESSQVTELKRIKSIVQDNAAEKEEDEETDEDELMSETLVRKKKYEDFAKNEPKTQKNLPKKEKKSNNLKAIPSKPVEVDPTKFISLPSKSLKTQTPDLSGVGDEVLDNGDADDDDEQFMTIAEAFADDDIMEEFKAEKETAVDKEKPKDISLVLPGWGCWGGTGIKVSARKRKRFTIKAKPAEIRKDHTLGNVIINEKGSEKLTEHQVSELPHPFSSASQFNSSIRMPIGKTWNPETAFQKLTKPKVVTKLGTIIQPIDADFLPKHQPKKKTLKKKDLKKKINKMKNKR